MMEADAQNAKSLITFRARMSKPKSWSPKKEHGKTLFLFLRARDIATQRKLECGYLDSL